MAEDVLDALFAPEKATPVEPPQEPVADQQQPRGADGKFAKVETPQATPPAPEPVTQPVQVQPPVDKPKIDPEQFKGYLDEREKRQALERERDELRKQLEAKNQPAEYVAPPSPQDDPQGYAEHIRQETQRIAVNMRFELSENMATEKHGEDAVKSAMQWALERAQQSPTFATEYMAQRDPINWAVKQQKRFQTVENIGDDEEAYVRRRAAEMGLIASLPNAPSQASPQPVSKAPAPIPSLAHASSAGGMGTVPLKGPDQVFNEIFRK